MFKVPSEAVDWSTGTRREVRPGAATVLIGADLCPIEKNQAFFVDGDAERLFQDLLPELQGADVVLANLECPLIEAPSPILKTGPTFGEPPSCLRGIQAAGIDILCLANNHILDHGVNGLRSTMAACAQFGVATVGAGADLASARRILVREARGVRIGFLAMAEQEFTIAGRDRPGANPLDIIDFTRNVREHEDAFDYLVVLVHGGDEFLVPSPRIQNTCRFLIEMGANAVIVQHPHTLGGYEEYRGGHIVYGQGALVMDEALYRDRQSFHEGFLVRLDIQPTGRSTMDIVPFEQSSPSPGARKVTGEREVAFRRSLEERSRAILDPDFVQAEWLRFCQENEHGYVSAVLGHGRILGRLNARGWLERLFYGRRSLAGVRNVVCCETHREALQTILDSRIRQWNRRSTS